MLAIPTFSLMSIPVFSFSDITDKINERTKKQLQSNIETFKQDEKNFYEFAYKKEEILSESNMRNIDRLDDFFLLYADTLADIIEDDKNRSSSLYNYFDELYTLTLKITTSISYIRSRNRQLNAA